MPDFVTYPIPSGMIQQRNITLYIQNPLIAKSIETSMLLKCPCHTKFMIAIQSAGYENLEHEATLKRYRVVLGFTLSGFYR